jgi:hypothetical protein
MKMPLAVPVKKKHSADYDYYYGLKDKEGINILHRIRFNNLDLKAFILSKTLSSQKSLSG